MFDNNFPNNYLIHFIITVNQLISSIYYFSSIGNRKAIVEHQKIGDLEKIKYL